MKTLHKGTLHGRFIVIAARKELARKVLAVKLRKGFTRRLKEGKTRNQWRG